jgi:hypothetical protein
MFQAYVSRAVRVDLPGAITLGRALVTSTDMVPWLPEPVLRAKLRLDQRLDKLEDATGPKSRFYSDRRSPLAIAGRNVDTSWLALYSWLEAIASLPGESAVARSAMEAMVGIFPQGVGLVRPPPLLEWAESEARLERIERGGFEATLRVLGGGPIVEAIRQSHETYNQLLSDTVGGALSSRAVTRGLDACVLAIHAYVTCVLAELYDGDPEEVALACTLLAPLDFAMDPMSARAGFFDQTLEAHPPPPPLPGPFDEAAWSDRYPIACAS